MSFDSLGLSKALLKAIAEKGYSEPTPIQKMAIPPVMEGRDVLASAQTGTGKTAGFILPILDRLLSQPAQRGARRVRALVLTPTRELAAQIQENAEDYSKFTELKSTVIFGGVGQGPQVKRIHKGVDLLIATPGRLLDLVGQGLLDLGQVEVLVLDEADRMLDMGFIHDIKRVLDLVPDDRQNLLFSATFNKDIKRLATSLLDNPARVTATPENTTTELVSQRVIRVDKSNKATLLIDIISDGDWTQVLVFTRTKHGANRLAQRLERKRISAAAIHGDKSQGARTRALAGFKSGELRVLVATDIAARGLDIPLLPHVVNYELPNVPEDYVHRIGRTGRAGSNGEALSLVSLDEVDYLKSIERLVGQKIESSTVEGFEPTETPEFIAEQERLKEERKKEHQRNRSRNRSKSQSGRSSGQKRNRPSNEKGNSGKRKNRNKRR